MTNQPTADEQVEAIRQVVEDGIADVSVDVERLRLALETERKKLEELRDVLRHHMQCQTCAEDGCEFCGPCTFTPALLTDDGTEER